MAAGDDPDRLAVGIESIQQRQIAFAGDAERQIAALADEGIGEDVSAAARIGHVATAASESSSSTKILYSCSLGLSASSSRT